MQVPKKKIKYPQNLPLNEAIKESGRSIQHIADKIGLSREVVSNTVHGHYKGTNICPLIIKELNLPVNYLENILSEQFN